MRILPASGAQKKTTEGPIKESDYLDKGFRNVDAQDSPEPFKAYLLAVDKHPAFQSYKSELIRRLNIIRNNEKILDIGCGLGLDMQRLSTIVPNGQVIGVDISQALLRSAKELAGDNFKNIEFHVGDAHKLEFPDNSIDACKIDRTLQHVENPQTVINEVYRALKPGGWMVSAEPDWSTFVISPDEKNISEIVTKRVRHPRIGQQLHSMYEAAGFSNIQLTEHLGIFKGFSEVDTIFTITGIAKKISEDSSLQSKKVLAWLEKVKKDLPPLTAQVTLFMVSGQKR